jgi:hypothetical protein
VARESRSLVRICPKEGIQVGVAEINNRLFGGIQFSLPPKLEITSGLAKGILPKA